MSFTIAVSGKGGTGKITFAGIIIRIDEEICRDDLERRSTFQLPAESKAVQAARLIFEEYIQ